MNATLRFTFCSLLLVLLAAASAPAAAQDGDANRDITPPPPPPTLEEIERGEAEEPEITPDDDPSDEEAKQRRGRGDADPAGWTLLERAVEHLARGERSKGHRLLEQLAYEYEDHPATAMSADALVVLRRELHEKRSGRAASDEEEPTSTARAELAFFQTLHGLALGTELCIIAQCEDPQAVVAVLGSGAALGLGGSLALTSDGITPGHALALNSGTVWGFANGLMLSIATDAEFENGAGVVALGQLLGLGASGILWSAIKPDAGQISMANSGGFWSGFLAFWAHGLNDFETSGETMAGTVLVAADVGILAGALLSREYPMSRGRTFVIDSGGILGFLAGWGGYVFVDPDYESASTFSLMAIGGTLTGLGLSTYLTRNWDLPGGSRMSASWSLMPTDGGAAFSLGGTF